MIMIKLMISSMVTRTKREIESSSEEEKEKENSEVLTIKMIIGITSSESLISTRVVKLKKLLKDQEK